MWREGRAARRRAGVSAVYSTCIFCNGALGRNEALEHFPVGRRLAFDAAKGRLWAVCPHCERWNLTPLETRWEAIEEAERAYRGMKLRVSSGNIGLARLPEGLELVRIGAPLRPEFAAWRYGDQFGRRRRRTFAAAGVGAMLPIAAASAPWLLSAAGILAVLGVQTTLYGVQLALRRRDNKSICATVQNDAGILLRLSRKNIRCAALFPAKADSAWYLGLPHGPMLPVSTRLRGMRERGSTAAFDGYDQLSGATALRALATMLPHVNRHGGNQRRVREAVHVVTITRDIEHLVRSAADCTAARATYFNIRARESNIGALPAPIRLALEMVLHEHDERRAMEGELRELEARWRDAEEIASIADSLTLSADIDEQFAALKRRNDEKDPPPLQNAEERL